MMVRRRRLRCPPNTASAYTTSNSTPYSTHVALSTPLLQADKAAHDAQMTQLLALQHARAQAKYVFWLPPATPTPWPCFAVPRALTVWLNWQGGGLGATNQIRWILEAPQGQPQVRPAPYPCGGRGSAPPGGQRGVSRALISLFVASICPRCSATDPHVPHSSCAANRYQNTGEFHSDKAPQYHMPDTGAARKMAGGD